MDLQQIERVRASYALLRPRAERFGAAFYRLWFELNPAARRLFAGDIEIRTGELMEMVRGLLELLDHPDQLLAACLELGQRQPGCKLEEAHYDDIGMALLKALHDDLGDTYTDEIEEAWATVYGEIAETMIASGQQRLER